MSSGPWWALNTMVHWVEIRLRRSFNSCSSIDDPTQHSPWLHLTSRSGGVEGKIRNCVMAARTLNTERRGGVPLINNAIHCQQPVSKSGARMVKAKNQKSGDRLSQPGSVAVPEVARLLLDLRSHPAIIERTASFDWDAHHGAGSELPAGVSLGVRRDRDDWTGHRAQQLSDLRCAGAAIRFERRRRQGR